MEALLEIVLSIFNDLSVLVTVKFAKIGFQFFCRILLESSLLYFKLLHLYKGTFVPHESVLCLNYLPSDFITFIRRELLHLVLSLIFFRHFNGFMERQTHINFRLKSLFSCFKYLLEVVYRNSGIIKY